MSAVVVGQLCRDLVLLVDEVPAAGGSAEVRLRREMLGGKGANQAVGLAQLGVPVALVAVAGDDEVGARLLDRAARDGIDTRYVVRRAGAPTGLIVDVLEHSGRWRYLEHLPPEVLLAEADVEAAAPALDTAEAVLVQLQQPPPAALAAARRARAAGALVLLDGAPWPDSDRDALLAAADVVRADAAETHLLTGAPADDPDQVLAAARDLLKAGPRLLAFALDGPGNLFVWEDGHLLIPLGTEKVVDTTGAGDAFVAALTAALLRGDPIPAAAHAATAAATKTVTHPGGRPNLA